MTTRGQTFLLIVGVVLLAVITIAVTFPYYAEWRAEQRRAELASAEALVLDDATSDAILKNVTATLRSASPFVEVRTDPSSGWNVTYESRLVIRVDNRNDRAVMSTDGHLYIRTTNGDPVANVPLTLERTIGPHHHRDEPVTIRTRSKYPLNMQTELIAETIALQGGGVARRRSFE